MLQNLYILMIQKNNIEIYTQYLERAFKSVIENTLKDQSLQILKEMQNKSFFQTRIHELFSQLYCAERQNKIKQLIEQAHALSIKMEVSRKQGHDPFNRAQYKFCNQGTLKENLQQISTKNEKDEHHSKQHFNLMAMIKQNQTLQKEIKSLKSQQLQEVQHLRSASQLNIKRLQNQLEKTKNKYLELERKYTEEKVFYSKEELIIEKMRKQQFEQQQKYNQLEISFKENENERRKQKQKIEMTKKQLDECKEFALVLDRKLKKLEEDKRYMNKKIEMYKILISKIENKNEQIVDENLHQQQQLRFQGQQREIQALLSRLQTKQIELKEQLRENFILKDEKSRLQKQYKQFKQNALMDIQVMKDKINRTKLQHQKQLNDYKNNEKQNFYSMRQLQLNAKLHLIGQQKSKIKELQIEKTQNQNKIIQLQFSSQNLTKKYQTLERSFQEEKIIFQKKIEQLEQKIENHDKKQKQLNKKIKMTQSFYNQLEITLQQKIRLYDQKNQMLISQLQREKEVEKKLVLNINELENKMNRAKIADKMNGNLLKQHEMSVKINELEKLLDENKSTFKELIDKKDEKLKKMKEQLENSQQKYTEIALKYSQETQKRENIEKQITEAEKLMNAQQQKMINLQERARKEMLELIRQRDKKIQEQRVYHEKYYQKLYSHKEYLRQKNFDSEDAKRFLEQDKQKQAIQAQVSRLRAKRHQLEVKLAQSEKRVKQLEEKMMNLIEQSKNMKKKECSAEQSLQMHKNKQIKMVNYYEQKILHCKNLFKEFRFEICHQFLDAIVELKNQLKQIKKEISKIAQTWKKCIFNVNIQVSERIQTCLSTMQRKIQNKCNKQSQEQRYILEKEKEQIIITYQNKLKQKQMDMLTLAAQRQFSMQQVRQNENSINKKYKDLENLHKKAQTKIEKSEKIELQLRNIISKMEMKVDNAEKECCIKEKQVYQLEQLVDQLREKVQKSENFYKVQLKNCREKYREQNQRIFNKYQRQFQKMINLNGKISKDKGSLASVSNFKGIFIPTKGNQQDNIQKLKREIQQQRKIVQKMENKTKW